MNMQIPLRLIIGATLTIGTICSKGDELNMVPVNMVIPCDNVAIATKAILKIPLVKMDSDMSSLLSNSLQGEDAVIASFLKAVNEKNANKMSGFLDLTSITISNPAEFVKYLNSVYSPPGVTLVPVGKIPLQNGFAYIFFRQRDTSLDFPILTVQKDSQGNFKVLGQNSIKGLDLVEASLKGAKLEDMLAQASPMQSMQVLTDVMLGNQTWNYDAGEDSLSGIYKAINTLATSSGKDGFTSLSQELLDQNLSKMKPDDRYHMISNLVTDAKKISYVINCDPVYISIQESGASQSRYFYLKSKDGKFLMTNLNMRGPIDGFLDQLPPIPQEKLNDFKLEVIKVISNSH